MEDLTTTQIILLALLISFVTSIATGIVTVSLLDQAPPGVTQTINRVVERTVEKVVPGQEASVITRETTVVVKEENLIVEAVDKNAKVIVRIGFIGEEEETILGLGVLLSQDGYIVTDVFNLGIGDLYDIRTSTGKVYTASVEEINAENGIAFLKVVQPEDLEEDLKFPKPSFGDPNTLRLGQSIVAIGGNESNIVSSGIVSQIGKSVIEVPVVNEDEEETVEEREITSSLVSNISFSSDYSGGPLIDVDGFLLGINIVRKTGDFSVPVNIVLDLLSEVMIIQE
jgi:S1-C subfamily serine protease